MRSRPRIKRCIGDSVEKEIPFGCQNWIIKDKLLKNEKNDDEVLKEIEDMGNVSEGGTCNSLSDDGEDSGSDGPNMESLKKQYS